MSQWIDCGLTWNEFLKLFPSDQYGNIDELTGLLVEVSEDWDTPYQALIGDINNTGSACSCCQLGRRNDFVLRYKRVVDGANL